MRYAVGIDIGGTKVAMGVVDEAGSMLAHHVIPMDLSIQPEGMLERICEEVTMLVARSGITWGSILGVGIGAPGPLDIKKGEINCPPNLPSWLDISIVDYMENHFSKPIILENDANAAALAEKWLGAAKGEDHFIYLTISTGIGAGIFCDGKLLHGHKGNAGDIGHGVMDPSFGPCACGQIGCLESIASGTAIAKRGSAIMGEELTAKEIFDLYFNGNTKIFLFIQRVFDVIGAACVSLINTFDAEKIVIGGGVTQVGEALFEHVQSYVSSYALNPSGRETKVVPAGLAQHAGVIGAAALCLDVSKNQLQK
ncbi:transcriptional regulator [Virgibacillus halodenitrificans]|uniref:Transcriptional regulator n=1 Tax=Virgibacillus halodenitrificans TaxID=1482 RepID=A0AAC9J5L2_VIRHA|nr:ROK family protein [Virgibacillus halodenitrificans]APC49649.1 transcriptional regulator [Virgibacillus halodenitrificans]